MLTILSIKLNNQNNNVSFKLNKQQNFNLSFQAIPQKSLNSLSEDMFINIKKAQTEEKITDLYFLFEDKLTQLIKGENRNYIHELNNITMVPSMLVSDTEHIFQKSFYPEVTDEAGYLRFQKKTFLTLLDNIKKCTNRWFTLEKWQNPNTIVPFEDVFDLLKKMPQKSQYKNISIEGLELLKDKKIKNPAQFYTYVSQPLGNAIKYGENKPFKIKIEAIVENGKKNYYASFINPETKPVSDLEIDKIIKGNSYRALSKKESKIYGTGHGFSNIIEILKENGYQKDIPNLIAKGRQKGVCVRIPLIGVC
jgi:hypothetical protein